ncbi:MAG: hypothetical protein LBP56_01180 [Odoribacteraceae bacterium]|jgi:hypothetical protein|nr:hypothetical protein [Odoribacteraceae bacterium]
MRNRRNHKISVILLLVVVLLVWGAIAFRIKKLTPGEAPPARTTTIGQETRPAVKRERVPLGKDVKDPFLGGTISKRPVKSIPVQEANAMAIRWPNVIYRGCITGEQNKRLGIVEWNGKPCHVREKKIIEGITVQSIKEEYILLEQKGKTIQIDKTDKGGTR